MATDPFPAPVAPERPAPTARPRTGVVNTAIGVVGELLITAGVLVGLFVVWQLFYTDVQAARVQAAALNDIAWAEPVTVPEQAPAPADPSQPAPEAYEVIPDELKVPSPVGAPVITSAEAGTTFGVLHVPRWGSDYSRPINEGTDREKVLNRLGIGHYEDTAFPGAVGNFAIAGHRTTYGKPFSGVAELQDGDALIVQTEQAWYVYRVTGHEIVLPEQVEVIAPVPNEPGVEPTVASITLTSCHPKFSAEKRYIVWGELEYWAPTGHGFPIELVEEA